MAIEPSGSEVQLREEFDRSDIRFIDWQAQTKKEVSQELSNRSWKVKRVMDFRIDQSDDQLIIRQPKALKVTKSAVKGSIN